MSVCIGKWSYKAPFCCCSLRQSLAMYLRLALNWQSSCLSLVCATVTGMYHHITLLTFFFFLFIFCHLFVKEDKLVSDSEAWALAQWK